MAASATAGPGLASMGPPGTRLVVKRRFGTQSQGTWLADAGTDSIAPDEFAEAYLDGCEYSVVVYREGDSVATFPPVWKGSVSPDLTPPWKRLRLCPAPAESEAPDAELRAVAGHVARAANAQGHIEVELLATTAGEVVVLEINPRVSGTMRISAMATGLPIFSLHKLPGTRGELQAVRQAGEVPYHGPAVVDPGRQLFATSRVTVAGADRAEVELALAPYWPGRPPGSALLARTGQGR